MAHTLRNVPSAKKKGKEEKGEQIAPLMMCVPASALSDDISPPVVWTAVR